MKSVFSLEAKRTLGISAVASLCAAVLVSLGGCSGTSTGAAAGTGGTSSGASGGSAGTDMTAAAGAGQTLVVNCTGTTYQAALSNCTTAGCHSSLYPASGMNLTPDSGLVSRLKDVPAKHEDIACLPSDATCTCVNYVCSVPPATCPPSGQALLVDSSDYTQSWILKKIGPADPMCGDQMPGGVYKTPNDMACIQAMVQAIAALPK